MLPIEKSGFLDNADAVNEGPPISLAICRTKISSSKVVTIALLLPGNYTLERMVDVTILVQRHSKLTAIILRFLRLSLSRSSEISRSKRWMRTS